MSDTISQGVSTWGNVILIREKKHIVSKYPIKEGPKVIGAVLKTIYPDMMTGLEASKKLVNKSTANTGNHKLCTCMDVIGETEPLLHIKRLARRASRTCSYLLITGESGTGKSLIAEAIHSRSVRRDKPFVKVNCAAIPENLLESELFGYVEGAFTGAKKQGKPGKFELAQGGTIFLDEIGDMPLYMQAKLLEVIQDKRVERIGSTEKIDLDIRIVSATNKDLKQMVRDKEFREDLYYRLKVLTIRMPSLRECSEDIPLFVSQLIEKINGKIGTTVVDMADDSIEIMKKYDWPGNIRQLENFLEQAVNYSDDSIIDIHTLPIKPWDEDEGFSHRALALENFHGRVTAESDRKLNFEIESAERRLIVEAIMKNDGNKSKAAKSLNIQRSTLYKKLKRLNIDL
jgi:transcriptional regulator with PAS, ATPase and Fis domain